MKNVVKCYKHFFDYFIALKTHGGVARGLTVLAFSIRKIHVGVDSYLVLATVPLETLHSDSNLRHGEISGCVF